MKLFNWKKKKKVDFEPVEEKVYTIPYEDIKKFVADYSKKHFGIEKGQMMGDYKWGSNVFNILVKEI